MRQTWIIYKSDDPDASGWEERQLLPSGSLTSILSEEWHYSSTPDMPQVGARVREYANVKDPGNGVTHGRDGDWIVVRVCQFASFDTDERIVICYCQYQPINAEWEELRRGASVDEILEVSQQRV